jgi:hypothetical protein
MASKGKLQLLEKTDGQNIFLSFNIEEGVAKSARNPSNIKNGGVTAEQLYMQFKDKPEFLRQSFKTAVEAFENAAKNLQPEMQYMFFGPQANVFYNCEIINSMTSNVIKYDKNYIVIHNDKNLFQNKMGLKLQRRMLDKI